MKPGLHPPFPSLPSPPTCSGSACLGLGVLSYPDPVYLRPEPGLIQPAESEREMKRQRNDGGAFLWTEEPTHTHTHTHERKTHRWISRDLASEKDRFPLKPSFSHLPTSIFQRALIPAANPPSIHLQKQSLRNDFHSMVTWSVRHQKYDFMVFPNTT